MKKLLLATVAAGSLALASAPAYADGGFDLTVGGYFKGYGVVADNFDGPAGEDGNTIGFLRDTELHVGGETTLDNGLTIGAHFEFEVDGADGTADVDESYLYFSGNWGRVNFGAEDGAAYLLQVAAPSADSNVDGIRQFIQPFSIGLGSGNEGQAIDYDQNPTGKSDKLTYLTPNINGFQAGVSYTPETANFSDTSGIGFDDQPGDPGFAWEVAARYEGQFNNAGVIVGAGYSFVDLEEDGGVFNYDLSAWNVGLDLDLGQFGFGVVYTETSDFTDTDTDALVFGVDYKTGPVKLGASYYTGELAGETDVDRIAGGVVYDYGSGLSFRGSINYTEIDNDATGFDEDGVALLLGTQVNF